MFAVFLVAKYLNKFAHEIANNMTVHEFEYWKAFIQKENEMIKSNGAN